ELGAVAQRHGLALGPAQHRQAALERVAVGKPMQVVVHEVVDLLEIGGRQYACGHLLQGPALARPATHVVVQAVQRDRIQPRLSAALTWIEAPARAQHPLAGIGQQVFGQDAVAGAIPEKGEQALGVLGIEPLEAVVANSSHKDSIVRLSNPASLSQESGPSFVSAHMSHSHEDEHLTDDLRHVADVLRDGRPQLDPLALDRVKLRAMQAARRSTSRPKGSFMKQRLTTLFAAGFLVLGMGGTLALAGGGDGKDGGGSASYHQYRPECPAGYVLSGRHCVPVPPPKCPRGYEVSGGKCVPTPPPTCPPGYELTGRNCKPIPVPHCPPSFVLEEGTCHFVGHEKGGAGDKGGGQGGQGGKDKGGSGGDKGGQGGSGKDGSGSGGGGKNGSDKGDHGHR